MVNWPTVTTLAMPEPLIVPIRPEEITATFAGPPRAWPTVPMATSVNRRDHAGALEERTEQDEQEDVCGGDVDRDAVDALGAEEHLVDNLAEFVTARFERARKILAEQAIAQEDRADDRQHRAHHAAAGLEHQKHDDNADDEIRHVGIAGAQNEVLVEDPMIEAEREADDAQRPIGGLRRPAVGQGGGDAEHHDHQEADMHRPHDLARQRAERGGDDLERGKRHRDPEQRAAFEVLAPSLIEAGLGLGLPRNRRSAGGTHLRNSSKIDSQS